jgi:hypothetical protein
MMALDSKENLMQDATATTPAPRSLAMRVLIMLLMCIAFQITAWVLVATAIVQLVAHLAAGEPMPRLKTFGRSAGRYLGQIADFVSFDTEEAPFPFSDWPAANP